MTLVAMGNHRQIMLSGSSTTETGLEIGLGFFLRTTLKTQSELCALYTKLEGLKPPGFGTANLELARTPDGAPLNPHFVFSFLIWGSVPSIRTSRVQAALARLYQRTAPRPYR